MDREIQELADELFKEMEERIPEMNLSSGVVKVMEELGEIADLALRKEGVQRRSKDLDEDELKEKLAKEICDTIIPLIMLAKSEDIDLMPRLKTVMEEEIERWKTEH